MYKEKYEEKIVHNCNRVGPLSRVATFCVVFGIMIPRCVSYEMP